MAPVAVSSRLGGKTRRIGMTWWISLRRQKQYAGALKYAQSALRREPDNDAPLKAIAEIELDRGKEVSAGRLFNRLLKSSPQDADALLGLARVAVRRNGLRHCHAVRL